VAFLRNALLVLVTALVLAAWVVIPVQGAAVLALLRPSPRPTHVHAVHPRRRAGMGALGAGVGVVSQVAG